MNPTERGELLDECNVSMITAGYERAVVFDGRGTYMFEADGIETVRRTLDGPKANPPFHVYLYNDTDGDGHRATHSNGVNVETVDPTELGEVLEKRAFAQLDGYHDDAE